jgi:anthranilate/para-aminobenzoate synthase component I
MSKVETAQKIWETSTKIFDKIEDNDKKEWFNSLIDQLWENSAINRLKKTWNTMTEEQKLKIYKRHSISVSTRLRYANIATFRIGEKLYHVTKNYIKEWKDNARKYATIEEIPCRFLVELWILDKPQLLTDEKLKEDIQKDAKNFNTYLWICEATCAVFDETRSLIKLIAIAKHYSKWYEKEWTKIIIERLNKTKLSKVKWTTNEELLKNITTNKPHKDEKKKKKSA